MSTTEVENKEISRRHAEVLDEGDMDRIEEHVDKHVAEDYLVHGTGAREPIHGPEGVNEYASMFLAAFPDLEVTTEDIIAEDNKVVRRDRITGTHEGKFKAIEPTGKEVEMEGIVINRIEDGQMVESWGHSDMLGLLQQLGFIVIPGPRLMLRMVMGKVRSWLFGG